MTLLRPHNILYIDDDESLAHLLKRKLERKDYAIDIVFSAEDGLESLDRKKYDLVLLDYHLPGMSGIEMLDIIMHREHAPPVILLTTGGDERVAVSALEKGAADYAVKDVGQTYLDLLPAIMQAAFTRDLLLRENQRQSEELKIAKEKAEAASQAKSNFLATMSHEMRTPLNVVTGLTTVLSKMDLTDEQRKIVTTLSVNADLLLHLINDLLDISRIESGHVMLENTHFSFADVFSNIRGMFGEQANIKGIALEFTDDTEGKTFQGDTVRVQQILANLVGNALKFTPSGKIHVTARVTDYNGHKDCVEIIVEDTGIGIEPDKIATIFDKFTQADETITRAYGGSGLGLSIVHSLIKIMDGDISVTSTPGHGSTFKAILCLGPGHATAPHETTAPAQEAICVAKIPANNDLLLVDDYAANVMVATLLLEDMGYIVETAESGYQAIEKIQSRTSPFHAILMDVQMHGLDGLQATGRIRDLEKEKGYRQTIIGMTAHALAGDRERCIAAGMDDYISKPINPDLLEQKLRSIK